MQIEKGIGKGEDIPQYDFGMWISDILRQKKEMLPFIPFVPKRTLPSKKWRKKQYGKEK